MRAKLGKISPQVDGRSNVEIFYTDDDGNVIERREPCLKDDLDFQAFADGYIPMLESQIVQTAKDMAEKQKLEMALMKIDLYITSLPDQDLKTKVGLTDDEIIKLKDSKGVTGASADPIQP